MTTKNPFALVEGLIASYDLPTTNYLMGDSNGKLQNLTSRLVARAMAYGMEVSTGKRKIMTKCRY